MCLAHQCLVAKYEYTLIKVLLFIKVNFLTFTSEGDKLNFFDLIFKKIQNCKITN